jgi:hypothetical protein
MCIGHAVNGKDKAQSDGWYSSKSSSSQSQQNEMRQYKQTSVLHLVEWRRVLFADVMGRKCFLAKAGTARVEAATALNAEARYVCRRHQFSLLIPGRKLSRPDLSLLLFMSRFSFFIIDDENEEETGMQALLASDKTALTALTSVLRVEGKYGTGLRENIIDFLDKNEKRERQGCFGKESSCNSSFSISLLYNFSSSSNYFL